MKSSLNLLIIFGVLLFIACKKDPPTLNEKIEGSWHITYYKIIDIIWNDGGITNGIAFKNEGANTGTVWFSEHRDFTGTKDTVIGSYMLDENAGTLDIKRVEVPNPIGITEDGIYHIDLVADTLILNQMNPHDLDVTVRAVRN